ncbi:MAG TPA: hypothetical protein VM846_04275 [Vicinamibacterales bacterium]|nr:hypothetical protein [Vicinamibacterales bacterium]
MRRVQVQWVPVLALVALCGLTVHAQNDFIYKAPTPTDWAAMAKLPDFSGVWEVGFGPAPGGARGAGAPAAAGGGRAAGAPPQGGGRAAGGGAPGAGAGGGRGRGGGPQLTPAADARRKELQAKSGTTQDSPQANCLPPGMPGIMGQPYPMEFLLTPGKVTIVIEAYQQVRHIYTDGRPLPDDPDLKFHGTSIGRWEGDTLIVDTVGFSPLTEITRFVPFSAKARIVERFRLSDADTMSIETTITDPENLAAPVVSSRSLRRHRNWTTAEYICEENNRNFVDSAGKAGIDLTLPAAKK